MGTQDKTQGGVQHRGWEVGCFFLCDADTLPGQRNSARPLDREVICSNLSTGVFGKTLCVELSGLFLRRTGVPLILGSPAPEGDNWVDVSSPHARTHGVAKPVSIPPTKNYLVRPCSGEYRRQSEIIVLGSGY